MSLNKEIDNLNSLQETIDKRRAEIKTDGYAMSIGELISLYEKNEIDIHPEFQRFFRWTPIQKTRLIESILLGIPIPQIFVAQRSDGVWDVVDGLQRLSTIYQFVGILKDEQHNKIDPLILEGTKYIPALANKKWDDAYDPSNSFTQAQRLYIKRAKIEVSIILKESDETSKYELFQRLNTGGTPLSDQEARNCILIMLNKKTYEWLGNLTRNDDFQECISLTDRALEERYDFELALRFVIFRLMEEEQLRSIKDLGEYLTDKMVLIANDSGFDYDREATAFRKTFSILREATGADSFRKYDPEKQKFTGGFSVSAFEAVALGVGFNFHSLDGKAEQIKAAICDLWSDESFVRNSKSGLSASSRLPRTIPLGRGMFKL